ncbi:hypothetical protein GCM10029963_01510 [Micromonospora andamanensis]
MSTLTVLAVLAVGGAAWTVPYWLPPAVVRLREWVFARVNGVEGVPVPGPTVGIEHFERVYADPAADGRSRGPGCRTCSGTGWHPVRTCTRNIWSLVSATGRWPPRRGGYWRSGERADALATAATRRVLDELPPDRISHVRLRDLMMPVWAEVFHEVVFDEVGTPAAGR